MNPPAARLPAMSPTGAEWPGPSSVAVGAERGRSGASVVVGTADDCAGANPAGPDGGSTSTRGRASGGAGGSLGSAAGDAVAVAGSTSIASGGEARFHPGLMRFGSWNVRPSGKVLPRLR